MCRPFHILPQPNDYTCGPTCLHAIYSYYETQDIDLWKVLNDIRNLADGGTLAVFLANHALKRGYSATIYTYNMQLFDLSWQHLDAAAMSQKLTEQLKHKRSKKLRIATEAYLEFLQMGGQVRQRILSPQLLMDYLSKSTPLLTGLSATYLYRSPREFSDSHLSVHYNDVKGTPQGHFVVLCGIESGQIVVADPYQENPMSGDHFYRVEPNHLINAILLGIITYDANVLVLEPK